MLQDDHTMATEVTLLAREHFNKLASLSVKVQGARELGVLAAHSPIGDSMVPTEFVIEKMAANWARRRAVHSVHIDFEKTSEADLEKLAALAYDELGAAHMEKLAEGILAGEIMWNELSDMEKVALNIGGALSGGWKALKGGIGKATKFLTKGRTVPGTGGVPDVPKVPKGPSLGERAKETFNVATGKGRTVKPPSAAEEAMEEVTKLRREGVGTPARRMEGGSGSRQVPKTQVQEPSGAGPYREAQPPPPSAPKHTQGTGAQASSTGAAGAQGQAPAPPKPPPPSAPDVTPDAGGKKGPGWWNWKTKLMLGTTAASIPATYLGGKALDVGKQFLTPQPPGTSYAYGQQDPSHFMRSQYGM